MLETEELPNTVSKFWRPATMVLQVLISNTPQWIEQKTDQNCRTNLTGILFVDIHWSVALFKSTLSVHFRITKPIWELNAQPYPPTISVPTSLFGARLCIERSIWFSYEGEGHLLGSHNLTLVGKLKLSLFISFASDIASTFVATQPLGPERLCLFFCLCISFLSFCFFHLRYSTYPQKAFYDNPPPLPTWYWHGTNDS